MSEFSNEPCKWCGCFPKIKFGFREGSKVYWCACPNCKNETGYAISKQHALDMWDIENKKEFGL